ncbi:MAG TPA: hypothetical protein VGD14_14515 [bacterium]
MANKRAYRLNSIGDVSHCLKRTINELRRGEIQIGEAKARGYLLNILLSAMEDTEIDQRMNLIEQKLKEKEIEKELGLPHEIN